MSTLERVNVTGQRTEIIVSPYGTTHAPRKFPWGGYMRRLDWRLTLCGQIAEHGWSQRRRYGYVTCRNCIKRLEAVA